MTYGPFVAPTKSRAGRESHPLYTPRVFPCLFSTAHSSGQNCSPAHCEEELQMELSAIADVGLKHDVLWPDTGLCAETA